MKTKPSHFLTEDAIDKLQQLTDDNNGIVDDDYIIKIMKKYGKAVAKEIKTAKD